MTIRVIKIHNYNDIWAYKKLKVREGWVQGDCTVIIEFSISAIKLYMFLLYPVLYLCAMYTLHIT